MSQQVRRPTGERTEPLVQRLHARQSEIERAVIARVYGISDPASTEDPEYVSGLRAAVSVAIRYAIARIGGFRDELIPAALGEQARLAARSGVGLDTVLRRYVAGHDLLNDFILEEAERTGASEDLKQELRAQAVTLDRLLANISEEYAREKDAREQTGSRRMAERVRRLLEGYPLDLSDLHYETEVWHLGVVATGDGAYAGLREVGLAMDCGTLIVRPDRHAVWGWLGRRRKPAPGEFADHARGRLTAEVRLALGEPGYGIEGWRHTHRQAKAAMPVVARGKEAIVRYTDVALLASALRDEVLAATLRDAYLLPISKGRDGGEALRQTLRAYFLTGGNASSAAAELRVSRQTVTERLRRVEEMLDRRIAECAPALETALRLGELAHRA